MKFERGDKLIWRNGGRVEFVHFLRLMNPTSTPTRDDSTGTASNGAIAAVRRSDGTKAIAKVADLEPQPQTT